ncbi:VOC family protein [Actinoplanes siamensis]|uniref:Glyoxalase n=1 Tax=Actinoplanes siamensis TaxID=1223317 RepID=A0A919N959_9ACTN|nr:VOC family protein [Actinoplanes siamensis]GIF06829.1 glyoxalase [Actinoplanes siamensis]
MRLAATTISSPRPRRLAEFYSRLLDLPVLVDKDGWVELDGLSFHSAAGYEPPAWPGEPGRQQMQMHLDIEVDDLAAGVARAVELGAAVADFQPQAGVRVCLDPDGHPFCLFVRD